MFKPPTAITTHVIIIASNNGITINERVKNPRDPKNDIFLPLIVHKWMKKIIKVISILLKLRTQKK